MRVSGHDFHHEIGLLSGGKMKNKRQEYIDFFTHMQEEDKKSMLGGMAWDGISWWIYNAVETDKLFTKEELADMFPYLLGFLKNNSNQ